jgi:hypothetical protein
MSSQIEQPFTYWSKEGSSTLSKDGRFLFVLYFENGVRKKLILYVEDVLDLIAGWRSYVNVFRGRAPNETVASTEENAESETS